MSNEEYSRICNQMDALIVRLGDGYEEDNPIVQELMDLSEKADLFFKQKHQDGYIDMDITLEIRTIVNLIVESRHRGVTVSELANELLWIDVSGSGLTSPARNP